MCVRTLLSGAVERKVPLDGNLRDPDPAQTATVSSGRTQIGTRTSELGNHPFVPSKQFFSCDRTQTNSTVYRISWIRGREGIVSTPDTRPPRNLKRGQRQIGSSPGSHRTPQQAKRSLPHKRRLMIVSTTRRPARGLLWPCFPLFCCTPSLPPTSALATSCIGAHVERTVQTVDPASAEKAFHDTRLAW